MKYRRGCLFGVCLPVALMGCSRQNTRVDFEVYDQTSGERRHYTDFERCWYQLAPNGMLELALRTERPSSVDPTVTISQLFYVKTFWNPRPGTTYAEATQINARVQYAVLTPPTGVRYDGAAFVSYSFNKNTGKLEGKLESGSLMPRYRIGTATEPFGPCHFTGTFTATENPREVIAAAQTLDTLFTSAHRGGADDAGPSRSSQ